MERDVGGCFCLGLDDVIRDPRRAGQDSAQGEEES